MSISFPASPTIGQIYQNWVWSGSSWDAVNPGLILQLRKQIFTASGVYTPSPGMFQADVEVVGGGGGGGGSNGAPATSGTIWVAGGGAAGSYSKRLLTAAQIGGSQTITIGVGGTAGPNGPSTGGAGGASSFGSLVTASGGAGGANGAQQGAVALGGAAGIGDIALAGENGGGATFSNGSLGYTNVAGGGGGSTPFGIGGQAQSYYDTSPPVGAGRVGTGYGSGGGGAGAVPASGAAVGAAGRPGLCIVTEYCWVKGSAIAAQALSGARVLVSSQTISTPVASVAFIAGLDDTTIDTFEFEFFNVQCAAGGTYFATRFSSNYGSTWDATTAYSVASYGFLGDGTFANVSGGATYTAIAAIGGTPGAQSTVAGRLSLWTPWSTTFRKSALFDALGANATPTFARMVGGVQYFAAGPPVVNGVQFFVSSGQNFTAGTFKLWKVVR